MTHQKQITVVAMLLIWFAGCMNNDVNDDIVRPVQPVRNRRIDNLHTGQLEYRKEYNPNKPILLEDPNHIIIYNVDVLLEKGSMTVDLTAPDETVYKSLVATPGEHITMSERLPAKTGKWNISVKGKGVEGLVTIGFTSTTYD